MATLTIIANGVTLDPQPEFPIEREDLPIGESKRHRSGQLRQALIATKKRLRYGATDLTEAQRALWLSAHPWGASYSHVDELGVTRTVITVSRRDPVSASEPTSVGTPAFYDVEVEVEEV